MVVHVYPLNVLLKMMNQQSPLVCLLYNNTMKPLIMDSKGRQPRYSGQIPYCSSYRNSTIGISEKQTPLYSEQRTAGVPSIEQSVQNILRERTEPKTASKNHKNKINV